jgi:hypothetical protein
MRILPLIIDREHVKYTFTRDELVAIARDQARFHSEMAAEAADFENLRLAHKAKATKLEGEIAGCTVKVSSGSEMRAIKVVILKFRPDSDSALVVRTDNGRVLRKRRLDPEEKQQVLTTEAPETWAFEVDLYEDGDSDVSNHVATVPVTDAEAKELKEALKMKPLRKQLGDGKEPPEPKGKKK